MLKSYKEILKSCISASVVLMVSTERVKQIKVNKIWFE